ncbi:MAG: hypothetical protein ACOVP1_08285, partial [Bacteroidia bacterium]
ELLNQEFNHTQLVNLPFNHYWYIHVNQISLSNHTSLMAQYSSLPDRKFFFQSQRTQQCPSDTSITQFNLWQKSNLDTIPAKSNEKQLLKYGAFEVSL